MYKKVSYDSRRIKFHPDDERHGFSRNPILAYILKKKQKKKGSAAAYPSLKALFYLCKLTLQRL
jgi:hypothetical protein